MSQEIKRAAFVLGGNWNALAQIRALGRSGVQVFYFNNERNFVSWSRFCSFVKAPNVLKDPEGAIKVLIAHARKLSVRPVLFHTSDDWMKTVGEHEETLKDFCLFTQSKWADVCLILNKRELYKTAERLGVPAPWFVSFQKVKDMMPHVNSFSFPCIVKPEMTVGYLERMPADIRRNMGHRTREFTSPAELSAWAEAMIKYGYDVPVIVQDFIPGDATSLYTLTSYSDKIGHMVVGSVGHKIRQDPPVAGCITVGELRHKEEVFKLGQVLLDSLKYHGLANTEFKYDLRDGSYRLMEINPRLGKWNGSATYAGLNLAKIAYDDVCGFAYKGPDKSVGKDGAYWVHMWDDFFNCVSRYRATGFPEHHLGIMGWVKSFYGHPIIHSTWDSADPLPGISFVIERFFNFVERVLR